MPKSPPAKSKQPPPPAPEKDAKDRELAVKVILELGALGGSAANSKKQRPKRAAFISATTEVHAVAIKLLGFSALLITRASS